MTPLREEAARADERAKVLAEYHRMTSTLGFGDNQTEPAATPTELAEILEPLLGAARDHHECPIICELCGETLADKVCEHCYGSGCGPGTASLAYEECEWCAGAGKVHEGCVEKTYAELAQIASERERPGGCVQITDEVQS